MKTLRSFVNGRWHEASAGFTPLVDPATETVVAQASSEGVDFGAALQFARARGGPALRALAFTARGELLLAMSKALHARRDELIELSLLNSGVTRKDAKFDVDGATGTLAYYAGLAKDLGERSLLVDGEGLQLGRGARFWGQHVMVPLQGVALCINAFNFPAWGLMEKAACALLAGVPVVAKPATSTAWVAVRCAEILAEDGVLPEGALSLVCGGLGDTLEHLGPQDVVAFTGSASTALKVRGHARVLARGVRVNVEADSLNAAVIGPDVEPGSETWALALRDIEREITQKTGQKCTAVRRVLVPRERLDALEAELAERLQRAVAGNPSDASVTMGPLVSAAQLKDAVDGVAELRSAPARVVLGTPGRVDGIGSPAGKGYFFAPVLLRCDDAHKSSVVHEREVFGPVATLMPYDGGADEAAELVGLGGGSLVCSVYSDDAEWTRGLVMGAGAWNGRLYLGSEKVADQAPGSGLALPQSLHGGPGRAGGGVELGGVRGLKLYMQTVALQGNRSLVERLGA